MMMKAQSIKKIGIGVLSGICTVMMATQRSPVSSSSSVDPGHTRYSALTQIDTKNVNDLKPVWVYDSGAKGRGWEVTPVIADGMMYVSIPGAATAVDPETGKELWRFTPEQLSEAGQGTRGRLLAGRRYAGAEDHLHHYGSPVCARRKDRAAHPRLRKQGYGDSTGWGRRQVSKRLVFY